MGEYEPEDSRLVTQSDHQAPGEPPRTGPREDAARRQAERDEREEQRAEGQMDQDMGTAAAEHGKPLGAGNDGERGEPAADLARLRLDARRPLDGG